MSRQTPSTYISHHHQLKQLWDEDCRFFSHLSPNDQLDLHKYFLLSLTKTDQELLDHRQNVKLGDPSLANRAGKACAKLMRGEEAPIKHFTTGHDGRRIYIRTTMRPQPDIELLAKALLALAIADDQPKEDKSKSNEAA